MGLSTIKNHNNLTLSNDVENYSFESFNSLITFSESVIYGPSTHSDTSNICVQDQPISLYPYIFNEILDENNTNPYDNNLLGYTSDFSYNEIPRNIFHENSNKNFDISGWIYIDYDEDQRKLFVDKHFPDKLSLYNDYKYDEQRRHLFSYLWLYLNGGVYISKNYELLKSFEPILVNQADLYFTFDEDRFVSPNFLISKPFCNFWYEVFDLMTKRKYIYEIDYSSGRKLLTDALEISLAKNIEFKYNIISRMQLCPYNSCNARADINSDFEIDNPYLVPISESPNIMKYIKCQTGATNETIYISGVLLLICFAIIIIVLLFNNISI